MGKFVLFAFACAAAVGFYMYWFRKSPDAVRDEVMSASARARDYATDIVDRAGDVTERAATQAREQFDRTRETLKV